MADTAAVPAESATAPEAQAAETTVPATEQAAETTPTEKTAETPPAEPTKGQELGKKGNAEVIRLRKRAQEAEKEAAYHRGRAEALAGSGKTEVQASGSQYQVPMPVQKDDESLQDFTLRLSDWQYDRRKFEDENKAKQSEAQSAKQKIAERARASAEAGEKEFPDFAEVVGELQMPNALMNEVLDSDIGHKVAYFFGQNPQELARIAALPERAQIKEFARLEDKLKAGVITTNTTKAPEPPPTVRAGSVSDDEKRYLDPNTSTAERIRISQARKAAARKGQ